MEKSNILFITRAYGEHAGGMERLSFEFIQAAKRHSRIEAKIIANETKPNQSLFQTRIASIWFALTCIPTALGAARRADVVHIGDPVLSLVGWLIKKVQGKSVVVTIHGLDVSYTNPLYRIYLWLFFRSFDLYLPISSYAASLVKQHRVAGRVEVLTPGIHDRYYEGGVTHSQHSQQILFTSGRLVKRKGHEWFIRNVLPKLPRNVSYVIAGTGPEAASIELAAQNTGVADRVKLLGRVSEAELKKLYNTIDIFVQPNIPVAGDAEGFGIVLLEAALCNRSVVAANLEGIPAAIHDGKNGWLVPTQDTHAWIKMISDILAGEKTLSIARNYTMENFNWRVITDNYQKKCAGL